MTILFGIKEILVNKTHLTLVGVGSSQHIGGYHFLHTVSGKVWQDQ